MNKELRNWILGNIEVVSVFVLLTLPLWIVPFCLYQFYLVIRDVVLRAV
jgi:hypothetical protein